VYSNKTLRVYKEEADIEASSRPETHEMQNNTRIVNEIKKQKQEW